MRRNDDLEDLDEAGCSDRGDEGDVDGISERVGRILRAEGHEDLLLRWIRALDLQVVGACRADERMKPLLKLNLSAGAAEDHLMAQLNQHFDAAEVGMLIRCLCVPLVSMRVGKVNKIGNMLFPTNLRGNLNLMLSPLSDMRILFCGDDGSNERLGLIFHNSERSEALVEEIPADRTGRSFLLKLCGDQILYFWCSEKSNLAGSELLKKMTNLFQQRPSLSQLTGICESRLDSFASYLMTNAFSSAKTMESKLSSSSSSSLLSTESSHSLGLNSQSLCTTLKPSRTRPCSGQMGKTPLYQGSLSPRSNAFKDGPNRVLLLRNCVREKLKQRVDNNLDSLVSEITSFATSSLLDKCSSSCQSERDIGREDACNFSNLSSSLPVPSPSTLSPSLVMPLSSHYPFPDISVSSRSMFSPYYCWCPPSSSLHMTTPRLPPFPREHMTLPPLSTLIPTVGSNLFLSSQPPCVSNDLSTLDIPALLPPSSFVSSPASQHILSFTPFMAEPIVHIPLLEVCSSGPGYLVSAGPAIPSSIPLLPKLGSLSPETESMAEKNARETLRMLMASTSSNPRLMKVLPAVLTSVDENISYIHGRKQGLVVAGSRGLYAGSQDVDAVVSGISCLGLSPSSSRDACDDIHEDVDECLKCVDHGSKDIPENSKKAMH